MFFRISIPALAGLGREAARQTGGSASVSAWPTTQPVCFCARQAVEILPLTLLARLGNGIGEIRSQVPR